MVVAGVSAGMVNDRLDGFPFITPVMPAEATSIETVKVSCDVSLLVSLLTLTVAVADI